MTMTMATCGSPQEEEDSDDEMAWRSTTSPTRWSLQNRRSRRQSGRVSAQLPASQRQASQTRTLLPSDEDDQDNDDAANQAIVKKKRIVESDEE